MHSQKCVVALTEDSKSLHGIARLTCYSGTYLYAGNSSCLSCNFDNGFFVDPGDQQCKPCDSSCKTCTSTASTSCLSCYSGTYLLTQNNSCVSCSISGYFVDNGGYCQQCDSTCATCSGSSTNCLSCPSSAYLHAEDNSCRPCTANGSFIDPSDQQCKECDESYQTCIFAQI